MSKGLLKDLFREIKKNKGRFLSIFFIVTLGVAFLSGVRAAEPDMLYSIDRYYDEQNFMDIRVISTLGLTREDVSLISSVKGVSYAVGARTSEVFCHFTDNSLDTPREETRTIKAYEYIGGINEPAIIEGSIPKKENECVIDYKIADNFGVKVGDEITLFTPDGEELSDSLKCETYKVTGTAKTPWYLTYDRGTGSIGDGKINYFIMIPSQAFTADYYSEIYVQAEGADKYITGSKEYDDYIETVTSRIETLEAEMGERRVEEVKNKARTEAYSSDEYTSAYEKAYKEAYDEAYQKAYDEALSTTKASAREEALKTAKEQAYDEALKKVKEEGLAQALETAREEAGKEAIDTAKSQAYDTAKEQALETAKAEAWKKVVEEAYTPALEKTKQEAYDKGLSEVNLKVSELTEKIVSGYLDNSNEQLKDIYKILDSLPDNLDDIFGKIEIELPSGSVDISLPDYNKIYRLIVDTVMEIVKNREVTPEDKSKLVDEVIAKITPDVEKLYKEYFDKQFDSVYKAVFDLKFEDELKAGYYDEFEKQFEETFDRDYKKTFDDEFEKTFNEQYLDQINEKFDETFDTQYAPLVEYQFEKTFESEYKEKFDNEFEETFNRDYLDTFNEEFEKTFESDYQQEFDDKFKDTFENQYKSQFDEEFEKGFKDEFDKEVEGKLEDIKAPVFYILGRGDSVASYIEYKQDAEAIGKIGNVFPLIFFLVAALVALTNMTRMVEDERSQIGTLKALGYSNLTIAGKYILYTLLAAVLGSILGCAFGEFIFPFVIMNAYGILFSDIPAYYEPFQWDMAFLAGFAAVGTILFATLAACFKSTREKPASLMRPPAPKAGKRILLEHITFLWKHLSFTAKSSMRNLFRYKKRLFMTVFGIGGCMGLLLVGFGLRDSILTIAKYQYRSIFVYDAAISLSADAKEEDKDSLIKDLSDYDGIKSFSMVHSQTIDVSASENSKSLNLLVFGDVSSINDYIRLTDTRTGADVDFPSDGIAISEKAARQLGVSYGDTLSLKKADETYVSAKVSLVFKNYVHHYILMSSEVYTKLFGDEADVNMILTDDSTRENEFESAFSEYLMERKAVSGVSFLSQLDDSLDNMLNSLDVVIWVLIISAALLAFVVLYNLNNINISERRRELATIKVLGFYNGEVAAYVYRDNIWLTAFGAFAGVFIGRFLHGFIIKTVEVDLMMFGQDIFPESYILSVILTVMFSAFVNFIMYFQLKKINMVESLKSVE